MKTVELKLSDSEAKAFIEFLNNKKLVSKLTTAFETEEEDEDEDAEDEDEEGEKPAKKVVKKKKPVEDEDEDEDATEEEDEDEGYTQDRVREKCQQLIQKGKAAQLKKVLGEFGYTKVVQLKPKDFEKFMLKANKIK